MNDSRRFPIIGAALILVAAAAPATAQHAGDIILTTPGGVLTTNRQDAPGVFTPQRVFAGEFGLSVPNLTDEPGFDSPPGTFAPTDSLGFIIRRALRVWDGSDFDAVPAEKLEISFGPLGPVPTPAHDAPVTGFSIRAQSNGQWHRHLDFELSAPAGAGVYLLELELFHSHGLANTAPFWIVFNQNAGHADHDAAIAWVEANLAGGGCPADFNGDGFVDFFDFDEFVICFEGNACPPGASPDFNGDGFADFFDYDEFVIDFEAGCP